jgi:hypothetical protein
MSSAITRRDVLRRLATGSAAAAALPLWVENLLAIGQDHAAHQRPAAPAPQWTPKVFDAHQNETVITLSELIIPQTGTPGAKAAKVNEYIDSVLSDASPADRDRFLQGLAWLDIRSQERYNARFTNASPEQQIELLTSLSTPTQPSPVDQRGVEFFQAIKGLTITGYYNSEAGLVTELGDPYALFATEFKGCTHPEHM